MIIVDVWQGSEYASDFEYASALNIPGLWICQGSEYASDSEYVRVLDTVLNMPGLHGVLNMPEYAWIIPGYAWLCLNVPKSVWMVFASHLPIVIPYLKEP